MTNNNPNSVRAAVYTRVSTTDQVREGFSLSAQEAACREYAAREGWEVAEGDVFREEGVSGAKASRPKLDRLRARFGDLDVVVIKSLDRLARSTKDLLSIYEEADAAGVTLVFLRERLDTSTAVGRLLRTILAAIAEFERELILERTASGIRERTTKEAKPWGEPGFGYARGDDGHWVPDPAEVAVARRLLAEYVERTPSFSGIAAVARRQGLKTRRGNDWTPAGVRKLLTSRHLLGEFAHKGEWREGRHPTVVDPETWQAAQRIAKAGAKFASAGRTGRSVEGAHVFIRGALRCGVCGAAMLPRSARDQADFYVCRTRSHDTSACRMPRLKRADVDGAALRLFEASALDVGATREHLAAQLSEQAEATRAQMARAERDASQKSVALTRFDRDYETGALSAAGYERNVARVAEELAGAEAEVSRLAAQAESTLAAIEGLDAESETLRRLAGLRDQISARIREAGSREDVGALRAAILDVFEVVYVGPSGTVWPAYPEDDGQYVAPVETVRNRVTEPSRSVAEDGGLLGADDPAVWADGTPPLVIAPVPRQDMIESWAALNRVKVPFATGKTSRQGSGVPE